MSRWVLSDDRRSTVLVPLATTLDRQFGFDSEWYVSDEYISKLVPVEQTGQAADYIVISPDQIAGDMARAKLDNKFEEFCWFYVMAHEKAHAYQARRERDRGNDFLKVYQGAPVKYELEADHIAGLLHFEEQLLEIGERVENVSPNERFSAFSHANADMIAAVKEFTFSMGNERTHGSGEARCLEFLWGRAWGASARYESRQFEEFFPEFLAQAEINCGVGSRYGGTFQDV